MSRKFHSHRLAVCVRLDCLSINTLAKKDLSLIYNMSMIVTVGSRCTSTSCLSRLYSHLWSPSPGQTYWENAGPGLLSAVLWFLRGGIMPLSHTQLTGLKDSPTYSIVFIKSRLVVYAEGFIQ